MASRVLWFALVAIAVVLAALSPVGLRQDRSTRLRQQELTDPDRLLRSLDGELSGETAAAVAVRGVLTDAQQAEIRGWISSEDSAGPNASGGRGRSMRAQLLRLLNDVLKKPQLSDLSVWDSVPLSETAAGLRETGHLSEADQRVLNLHLLAAAFPESIAIKEDPAIVVTYAGSDMTEAIDVLPSQFARLLDGVIVAVLSVFLGFLGVFGSLLVTASLIPRTFEPGEISLLLSKPVSRTVLFLTKFAGGCLFTLICAVLLVGGVWLILGFRLQTWRPELLWCIPLYVFLFAIYFSVSAVAGAIWRNANVALIVVVLFWVSLFTLERAHDIVQQNVIRSNRLTDICPADEDLFVVDGSRHVYRWEADKDDWEEVFAPQDQGISRFVQRLLLSGTRFQPVYDGTRDRILALQPEPSRFGGRAAPLVVSGTALGGWERESEGRPPTPVTDLLLSRSGRVVLPGKRVIYEFVGQSDQQKRTQQYLSRLLGGLVKPAAPTAFQEIQQEPLSLRTDEAASCLNAETDELSIFDQGLLVQYEVSAEGQYAERIRRDFEIPVSGLVCAAGRYLLLALANGNVLLLDAHNLQTITEQQLPGDDAPLAVAATRHGPALALLTHGGHVLLKSANAENIARWNSALDGKISAVAFNAHGQLLLADGRRTILTFEADGPVVSVAWRGQLSWVYTVYDWVLDPLHRVLPRPGDLDDLVKYLVTGEKLLVLEDSPGIVKSSEVANLQAERVVLEVWQPVLNNGLFIIVVLACGCLYITRHDF